ncbi:PREDICTED: uncharacterized protein LOC108662013 [Theobroma cacao]|uniref:Uncharacterized protein LOC108662013 n=1 Tax=Theobroma cacao TaxID=3641 RepID=A0AB32WBA5_THECC|nr:PREDICTED: uncharacterized protein LOC108662013 [Theobroma cacao]
MASNVSIHLQQLSNKIAVPANENGVSDQPTIMEVQEADPSEKKPPQSDNKRPRIVIKIRIENSNKATDDPATNSHANATTNHGPDKGSDQPSSASKASSSLNVLMIESKPTQTMTTDQPENLVRDHSRKVVRAPAKKKERKPPFSVTLSRKEIEEDLFGISNMRNKKLMRNPKKRSRDVQRQLDRLFPGLM